MPWTEIFSFTDGPIVARAEVRDGDSDDVRFFLSEDGGATTTSFDDQITDADPKADLFVNWMEAVAGAYGATHIDTNKFHEAGLDAAGTGNFGYDNTRIIARDDGDWQVKLAGSGIGGSVNFRFKTEDAAQDFNVFFEEMKTFVENNDVRNEVPICFTGQTLISCDGALRAAQDLRPGDRVLTQSNGIQTVRWIWTRTLDTQALQANPKLYPVRITAGALGPDLPRRDLLVSRQHRMLLSSQMAQREFDGDVLVAAILLTDLHGIFVDTSVSSVTYVHFMFDAHEIVFAEGAPSESLFTGYQALKTLTPDAFAEIVTLFPEVVDPTHRPPPAAAIPSRKEQKAMVAAFAKSKPRAPLLRDV